MKLALIFLSIFVAVSHQHYFGHPPMIIGFPYWLVVPFPSQPAFFNVYNTTTASKTVEKKLPIPTGPNSRNDTIAKEEALPDAQSRIKGFNHFRPSASMENQQQTGRFFFNLGNNGNNLFNLYNPVLKTATFTFTLTVTTISSVVTCVPGFQFLELGVNPVPPVCAGRKKRQFGDDESDDDEVHQFPIVPSETLKLTPTVITSSHLTSLQENRLSDLLSDQETNFQSLTSSQGDDVDQGATEDHHFRGRRFVFVNRNKFVVSSTITTYAFVPTILTQTINLVVPVPNKQCTGAGCADCIPPGYIICPAA